MFTGGPSLAETTTGYPLATQHYYYCVMRGSCIGVDYDYVIDVVMGSKACIAGQCSTDLYDSCGGI